MNVLARKPRSLAQAAALACALLAGPAAQAAIVSGTWSFEAVGLPLDPIVGSVSFSFDNSASFFNAVDGATANGAPVEVHVDGLNLPGGWTPVLTFIKSGVIGGVPVEDLMSIGHVLNGTQTFMGTDDWRIAFNRISTAPSFREFTYTSALSPGVQFQTFVGSVSAVPEPGTPALLALGLLSMLVARRAQHGNLETRHA